MSGTAQDGGGGAPSASLIQDDGDVAAAVPLAQNVPKGRGRGRGLGARQKCVRLTSMKYPSRHFKKILNGIFFKIRNGS